MYRVRAAGILLLGAVWMGVGAAAQGAAPAETPQDPGINPEAASPLFTSGPGTQPAPCGPDMELAAPMPGGGQAAPAGGADGTAADGTPARFLSQGTVQVPTSGLVALGIVVGASFGGAAGLAASTLVGRRGRTDPRIAPPSPPPSPAPAPGAPSGPADLAVAAAPRVSPPATATERPQSHLERLVTSVKANPGDGESRFDLALELMRRNEVALGMRQLATSFTLYPQGVVRLLEDPTLVKIREHPEVVLALRALLREQQRRFTGYV